ncbi:MAG: hypothetical protein RMI94_05135 [Bryobacterales bacterium]|nr:hypothetical protein [Bryobacteraceae bacterium]MDW8129912.1 hypothetical protein [Bryobacterales bacterium]
MKRPSAVKVHVPGVLARLKERIRGREQKLVRGGWQMPLLLLVYPRGAGAVASELEHAYAHALPASGSEVRGLYGDLWRALPALIVVQLRERNPCGCLGHHHPPGTESRLARRLASELGHPVAEIDLAYESIRAWQPEPLASLAAEEAAGRLEPLRLRAALLAVLLHEMEHLAFPERSESEILHRSRTFYRRAMSELVGKELGKDYGIA